MFYLLLLTDKLLCLTTNTYLPFEFFNKLKDVKTFKTLNEAELYIHSHLSCDNIWDLGLGEQELVLGKVYRKY